MAGRGKVEEQFRRIVDKVLGQAGELVGVGGRFAVVLHDLRHAAVAPLGGDVPFSSLFNVDRLVPLNR